MTLQLLVKDTTVSFNSHGIYNLLMYRQVNGNNQQWMFRLGGGKCITRDQWQHKLKGKLKTGACANTSRGAKGTAFREKKVVLGGWSRVQGLKGLELRSREMLLRRSGGSFKGLERWQTSHTEDIIHPRSSLRSVPPPWLSLFTC